MKPYESLQEAEKFFQAENYNAAAEIYISLAQYNELSSLCNYRLAAISNNTGDPLTAYSLYYKAFSENPHLASMIYSTEHSSHNYVYTGKKEEKELTSCPLCDNSNVQPKWCYPLTEAMGYNEVFNPIRLWMYCEPCHHMYARYFPENLFIYNDAARTPNTGCFSYYSNVLNHISRYSRGSTLLEVGIGACECLLVAREMGYDTFGIDVIEKHVQMARNKFGFSAQTADFVEYKTDKKFDIIIMGDVIEHVSDPISAMNNAYDLLNDDGVIWVSTPNFDSAFSIAVGHDDAMKRQQYHLNYFSRNSFFALLDKCGLAPIEYNVSSHYSGSMEIIIVKSDWLNKNNNF